jgi:hypothetical protein
VQVPTWDTRCCQTPPDRVFVLTVLSVLTLNLFAKSVQARALAESVQAGCCLPLPIDSI